MAIVTKVIGTAQEDGAQARLEIDYDDADLRVRIVRIVNNHPTFTVRVSGRRANGTGPTYNLDGLPNQTTEVAVPTSPAARMQLTVLPNGRLDGVVYTFSWRVP